MGMTSKSMDAQTKRGTPGFQPIGAAIVETIDMADAQDTQAPPTQSPQTLAPAKPAAQATESTNYGGTVQAPITGWVNSGKVVATCDGKAPSTLDFGDVPTNSASVVAVKP